MLLMLCLGLLAGSDLRLNRPGMVVGRPWVPSKRAHHVLCTVLAGCLALAVFITVQAWRTESKLVRAITLANDYALDVVNYFVGEQLDIGHKFLGILDFKFLIFKLGRNAGDYTIPRCAMRDARCGMRDARCKKLCIKHPASCNLYRPVSRVIIAL